MADITMCATKSCASRETCKRYKAIPDKLWQSYCDFSNGKSVEKCDSYLKYRNREVEVNEKSRKEVHTKRS